MPDLSTKRIQPFSIWQAITETSILILFRTYGRQAEAGNGAAD